MKLRIIVIWHVQLALMSGKTKTFTLEEFTLSPQKETGKYLKIGVFVVMQCVLYTQLWRAIVTLWRRWKGLGKAIILRFLWLEEERVDWTLASFSIKEWHLSIIPWCRESDYKHNFHHKFIRRQSYKATKNLPPKADALSFILHSEYTGFLFVFQFQQLKIGSICASLLQALTPHS